VGVTLSVTLAVGEGDAVAVPVRVPAEGVGVSSPVPDQDWLREGVHECESVTRCDGEGLAVVLRVRVETVMWDNVTVSV